MAETFDEFKKKQELQRREAEKNTYGLGKLGESLMDRTLGVLKGTGQEFLGLGSKALGGISGFLGGPLADDATNFSLMGDELRQRGYENFYKGYKEGPKSHLESGEFDPLVKGELSKYLYPLVDDEEKLYTKYLKDAETKKRLDEENYDPSAAVNEFGTNYGGLSQRVPGVDDEFDNIFVKIKEREIASKAKQKVLDEEKSNLDTFPKLSIGNSATVEKMELEQKEMDAKAEAEAGYEDGGEDAYEKLQNSALEDIAKSKGEEVTPETKEELLAKYKKEFYEATGLDPSGKADKSSALMAMGLALMQNKAGKGFNVGRMLSAVGEAGEKALPKLEAAKKTAKAEAVAAGKYALGRVQAGESAAAAYQKEMRGYNQAFRLELLEMESDRAKQRVTDQKVGNIKNIEVYNGLKVNYGRNNKGAVFAIPQNALNTVGTAMRNLDEAVRKTDKIDQLLNNYSKVGGLTGNVILDWAKTGAVSFGLNPSTAFKDGMSDQDAIDSLSSGIIAQYKKLITQETGNGISNKDVERLEKLLGNPQMWSNPMKLKSNINEIRDLFLSKLKSTSKVAKDLQDPDMYATDAEWEKYKEDALALTSLDYTTKNSSSSAIDVR